MSTNNRKERGNEPGTALALLDVFVGKWHTEGVIAGSPSGPAARLKAVDTYEWLPGGFFLIHHVDGHMGEDPVKAIEMIGYDASSRLYTTQSYDNQGNVNAYQANLQGREWTISGRTERFTGAFSEDGNSLTGKWELSDGGGNWAHWMDIKLTRIT